MSEHSDEVKFAVMQNDLTYIKEKLNAVDAKVSNSYVSKEEFEAKFQPVQKIVYGMVTVILLAVMGALTAVVVQ